MAKNIVYIQANEKIAQSFQETFQERGIELIVAPSAEEALKIMAEQDIGLLLVDINIPDMRLSKLVEICTREFPTVIMNVCVDVMNSLLVTKLVNRHAIHKIFVAPWDVREMIDEIEESLDASAISRDRILQERAARTKNEEFQLTLHSLTDALKKQQYSYGTIRAFTDLFFQYALTLASPAEGDATGQTADGAGGSGDPTVAESEENRKLLAMLKQIFDMYLRMQTTEALDAANLSQTIRSDMEKLSQNAPGLSAGTIECTLPEGLSKTTIANIRFAIWMITYQALQEHAGVTVSVSTVSPADPLTLHVRTKGTADANASKKIPFPEQYLSEILNLITENVSESGTAEDAVWTLAFR